MEVPSDYVPGFEKARVVDAEMATRYIAHTTVGDPLADTMIAELMSLDSKDSDRLIKLGLEGNGGNSLKDLPPSVREFFGEMESVPNWVDFHAFKPGIRMFHNNSRIVLAAFVGGVLVEGFSTNISKSFFVTGRIRHEGIRRLQQNNRHLLEIFLPGGLEKYGDGWKLSVRIRLVHAQVRYLIDNSDEWDIGAWGTSLSAAHIGYATAAFSARLLKHMKTLGAVFNDEEQESFMAVWRYTGYLMGVPDTILFHDEEEALKLFEIGTICEPPPVKESAALAHSLVNSAPLLIDVTDPVARRSLGKYIFTLSRVLIGDTLADQLNYPAARTLGVLPWFRLQSRFNQLTSKFIRRSRYKAFMALVNVSEYDTEGISYELPDHLYAERSREW